MQIREKICTALKNEIVLGKLNPGERLVENHLTQRFGASRGPVREALTRLQKEGFVTLTPHKGASVAKISATDLEDYYSLIALLESNSVRWSVHRVNSRDIARLSKINQTLRQVAEAPAADALSRWSKLNLSFHALFWDRCGNAKLKQVVNQLRRRIFRFRYTSLMVVSFMDYFHDHEAIIEAVKQKDPEAAADAMSDHISRALRVLVDHFHRIGAD